MQHRVLVVDDNPVLRSILCDMLGCLGHTVAGEADGLDGTLELLASRKPDLITLDISLGEESGLDVLKAVRGVDAGIKVLAVTANAQKILKAELEKAAVSGILAKPFELEDLKKALEQLESP